MIWKENILVDFGIWFYVNLVILFSQLLNSGGFWHMILCKLSYSILSTFYSGGYLLLHLLLYKLSYSILSTSYSGGFCLLYLLLYKLSYSILSTSFSGGFLLLHLLLYKPSYSILSTSYSGGFWLMYLFLYKQAIRFFLHCSPFWSSQSAGCQLILSSSDERSIRLLQNENMPPTQKKHLHIFMYHVYSLILHIMQI